MSVFNMKKTCEKSGIHEFSRTRGGWMKLVEGYDKSEYGGYRFVGSNFVKVGNFDSDILNGLYLDQSTSVVDGEKVLTMNLFKITDGEVELLATTPKDKGWAYNRKFENAVKNFFANEDTTVSDVINAIKDITCNRELLHEVAMELLKENRGKVWMNETHFASYMKEACVYHMGYYINNNDVAEMMLKTESDMEVYHDMIKSFDYKVQEEYHMRCLYSFIKAHPTMKKYNDYELVFEEIAEDYYLNPAHITELRDYNCNILYLTKGKATHDEGYYFSFEHGIWAKYKTIYIVVPNVIDEQIKIQKLDLQII